MSEPASSPPTESEVTAAIAMARAYLTALGGDDPTAVAALVAPEFRNEHHAELGSGCRGREAYAERLADFFTAFPNRRYDIVELAAGPSVGPTGEPVGRATSVVVDYRFGADVDQTRIDIPGVMWITVEDGAITRRLDCWDSLSFHRQTGTSPAPPPTRQPPEPPSGG